MADKKADGPAKPGGAPRAVASVNDAVRIAAEASLMPPPRSSGRREAAALKMSSPRTTAAVPPAAPMRELGSIAPVVATDMPAASALAAFEPDPSLPEVAPIGAAVEPEVPEPSLPEPSLPEPAPMTAAVEPEVSEPSLPEPATPSVSAGSDRPLPDPVAEWIAPADAAPPADASPVAATLDATVAETLPEPSPEPTAELPAPAAPAAVAAVNVPTPPPPTTIRKMETIMTTAEDFMSFQQGNFEALVKSGQIWASGLQDLGRHFAATAQAQMDETMGTVKAIVGVKSLREAVELQSTLARSSMEKAVSEGGKITDATMKLAEQTMAPITARLTLAAEKFGRTAA